MGLFSFRTPPLIVVNGKITTEHQFRENVIKDLNELKLQKKIKSNLNKTKLPLRRRLLIMKYSKVIEALNMDNNKKKAEYLSDLLGCGYENIRKFLSNPFSGLSTKAKREDLTFVAKYLESKNLIEAANFAKKELLKLSPEKN